MIGRTAVDYETFSRDVPAFRVTGRVFGFDEGDRVIAYSSAVLARGKHAKSDSSELRRLAAITPTDFTLLVTRSPPGGNLPDGSVFREIRQKSCVCMLFTIYFRETTGNLTQFTKDNVDISRWLLQAS